MEPTKFKNSAWSSRFWRLKGVIKAMIFAWKNPRHVQVSIENTKEDAFEMTARYNGINDRGFLRVINYLGQEAEGMEKVEEAFKEMLQ